MAKLSSLVLKENVKIENDEREIVTGEDRLGRSSQIMILV